MQNIGLNDIHLYDINKNAWISLALFNEIPTSRWGHQMCITQTHKEDYKSGNILIFGGNSFKSFCDSSIYEIVFDQDKVVQYTD